MLVNSFYSSVSHSCGVSIFNEHLHVALLPFGINLLETNLRSSTSFTPSLISLVHYVPSGFISSEASIALMQFLTSSKNAETICFILHGLHKHGERRFQKDGICPDQEHHIRLMFQRAESIIVLSNAVAEACRTWQLHFGAKVRIVRLDHPGLFTPMRDAEPDGSYAFVGGISRPKKDHTSRTIGELIGLCEQSGIRIWQHWTNIPQPKPLTQSWRQTSGLLTDIQWSSLVSRAKTVLCPYQTRIQSVSGLISEALSAKRFVLATSFELALEMQRRAPALVRIEDDLHRWPDLILHLPSSNSYASAGIPKWDSFANCVARELLTLAERRAPPPMKIEQTMKRPGAPIIAELHDSGRETFLS
jgi:hypothetical protein